jgi:GNAT superfamily N-acetyltransferase
MEDLVTIELPDGLTARPATTGDAPAMYELIAACEVADDGVAEVDVDDITVGLGRHGFDPTLDSLLVFERDELVASAEIYRGRGEGDVRPSHRGRGVGAALLGWIEWRARQLGSSEVGQTKTDADRAARELFRANGYEPSWTSWMIRIRLDEPPPPPEAPPGIAIRAYRASDAREVHRVMDSAFTEWEGRDPEPYEVWAPQVIAHPAFRPELSPLALDKDEIVGVVISFDYPELGEGWIEQLATRATHRRRGIARALLRTSFGWFYEAGRRVAGVATDSRTGALGLYEKVGMHVERQYTRYTKHLSP